MPDAELTRKPLPTPSLRQLSCFKEVATHRSFSRAAQALSMSQPALSSAIRELETLLGTALFDRSTHHVRLTSAGEAVRPQVEWMINNFVQGVQDLQQLLKYQADTVRISCIPSTTHLLAPWLATWQGQNINILAAVGTVSGPGNPNISGISTVALDGKSYSAIKNRWMRCRVET
jgi:DNA-binding transcriptional LysR family regulator